MREAGSPAWAKISPGLSPSWQRLMHSSLNRFEQTSDSVLTSSTASSGMRWARSSFANLPSIIYGAPFHPWPAAGRSRTVSRFRIGYAEYGAQVNIRDLVPGDIVLLHTMGEVLAYKVDSSEAVWPDEMDSLGIQQGKDLLTLVTCTPYGLNDHRLLVHCERTEYVPEEAEAQGDLANRHWGMREWAVLIVAVVLLLVLLDVIVHRIRQKRKAKASPKHME